MIKQLLVLAIVLSGANAGPIEIGTMEDGGNQPFDC